MPGIVRTKRADADMLGIAVYIAQDNLRAADHLIDVFDQKFELLSKSFQTKVTAQEPRPKEIVRLEHENAAHFRLGKSCGRHRSSNRRNGLFGNIRIKSLYRKFAVTNEKV